VVRGDTNHGTRTKAYLPIQNFEKIKSVANWNYRFRAKVRRTTGKYNRWENADGNSDYWYSFEAKIKISCMLIPVECSCYLKN
jgi:hypothetical protein